MDDALQGAVSALAGLPLIGAAFNQDKKKWDRIRAGVVIALVPGAVWGVVGGVVQFYVFKSSIEQKQQHTSSRIEALETKMKRLDERHTRQRRINREKAEQAKETAVDIRQDVRVIRALLEDRIDTPSGGG